MTDNPISSPKKRVALNTLLFGATMLTTWFVGGGARYLAGAQGLIDEGEAVTGMNEGLLYMASLLGILLAHEMGHFVMAKRNRVSASLPYFLPMPFGPIGTWGAVIVMRGRIRSRNALMEVGAAGPLAGMLVAIPLLFVGLRLSPIAPLPETGALYVEGQSLLYAGIKWLAVGDIPEGHDVMLHPVAWAGWVGLFVTMLNLLPLSQLDGGHIFYALWGRRHGLASRLAFAGLFFLGAIAIGYNVITARELGLRGDAYWMWVSGGATWLTLGLIVGALALFRKGALDHPPTDDDSLSGRHRVIGLICMALFALTFTPVPLRLLIRGLP